MSKSEHPHAEYLRDKVDGMDTSDWLCQLDGWADHWGKANDHAPSILSHPEIWTVRRKPTPKVIDWSQLGRHVPVMFGNHKCGFLDQDSTPGHFYDGFRWWQHASIDTGLWVANHDGVNPWPEGVVVEVKTRNDSGCKAPPAAFFAWDLCGGGHDIIMSRFHSLEDGYSFGGES